jgi:hypothetical protein
VTTRRFALLLTLALAVACGCGAGSPTPAQQLRAAVKAAQAAFDPDSAGGTGYGTTARLVRRMGPGAYGKPLPFPDDFAFRPGVVYAGILGLDNRAAVIWVVDPSGRALTAVLKGPHGVTYQTRSRADGIQNGMTVIRPGVLSGDMIRAAFQRAGFARIQLTGLAHMADGQIAAVTGHTVAESAADDFTFFAVFHTAAQARKEQAHSHLLPRARSVVIGNAWISCSWKASGPDRSQAFAEAVARLRRQVRTSDL